VPPAVSAGLLVHRRGSAGLEVLIAHMGGPFWSRRDEGAWSLPKGEFDPDAETPADAAVREFREELGVDPPAGELALLGEFRYGSGKRVTVFAVAAGEWEASDLVFGEFEMEWPPRSGRVARFPEVDRIAWAAPADAERLLVAGQRPALAALRARLGGA
jgi:predicted NUDIX family NTP pyrophosphohydrolase